MKVRVNEIRSSVLGQFFVLFVYFVVQIKEFRRKPLDYCPRIPAGWGMDSEYRLAGRYPLALDTFFEWCAGGCGDVFVHAFEPGGRQP